MHINQYPDLCKPGLKHTSAYNFVSNKDDYNLVEDT